MRQIPEIVLPSALRDALSRGHPWVYRTHIPPGTFYPSGTWVRLRCGAWRGYALWDADGAIAARVFATRQVPDAAWLQRRVLAAWELRAPLRAAGHTAYRWVYGEGDGLPGLTVDRYAAYAIVQTYLPGARQLVAWLTDALQAVDPTLRGIVVRQSTDDQDDDRQPATDDRRDQDRGQRTAAERRYTVLGETPPPDLIVSEHGLRFHADLLGGQKTGLFLDHRENRKFLEGLSAGQRVLNCFSYSGAFSLYALRGGARSVTSNDIGRGLDAATDANIRLNGYLDPGRHHFVTADTFTLLEEYAAAGEQFDLLILDPPSFAKRREHRHAAVRAYTRLNALALRCVRPGGLLATASCTSQVGPETFREMLGAAAQSAGVTAQVIHEAGQPRDHPVPAGFPEGRYLKFLVVAVGEAR